METIKIHEAKGNKEVLIDSQSSLVTKVCWWKWGFIVN